MVNLITLLYIVVKHIAGFSPRCVTSWGRSQVSIFHLFARKNSSLAHSRIGRTQVTLIRKVIHGTNLVIFLTKIYLFTQEDSFNQFTIFASSSIRRSTSPRTEYENTRIREYHRSEFLSRSRRVHPTHAILLTLG